MEEGEREHDELEFKELSAEQQDRYVRSRLNQLQGAEGYVVRHTSSHLRHRIAMAGAKGEIYTEPYFDE